MFPLKGTKCWCLCWVQVACLVRPCDKRGLAHSCVQDHLRCFLLACISPASSWPKVTELRDSSSLVFWRRSDFYRIPRRWPVARADLTAGWPRFIVLFPFSQPTLFRHLMLFLYIWLWLFLLRGSLLTLQWCCRILNINNSVSHIQSGFQFRRSLYINKNMMSDYTHAHGSDCC